MLECCRLKLLFLCVLSDFLVPPVSVTFRRWGVHVPPVPMVAPPMSIEIHLVVDYTHGQCRLRCTKDEDEVLGDSILYRWILYV